MRSESHNWMAARGPQRQSQRRTLEALIGGTADCHSDLRARIFNILSRDGVEIMVDMRAIESFVDSYVACWRKQRPQYTDNIFEDNDFGCESLQVFRNGFEIEAFNHQELCLLSVLLTRALRGQINRDHKIFWSWCSFLTFRFSREVQLFQDHDWVNAFSSLVNLLLARCRRFVAGPASLQFYNETLKYVNHHLLTVEKDRYLVSGPLAFAVLEGLLRRKNRAHVDTNGIIHTPFQVKDSKQHKSFNTGGRLNRIDDSLRLFEQVVVNNRGRPCPALGPLKDEIIRLYQSATDPYDLIDSWRNVLVHGKEFWQNRIPTVMNIVCLLVIDEIEPSTYDSGMKEIRESLQRQKQIKDPTGPKPRAPWDIFPPDLNY